MTYNLLTPIERQRIARNKRIITSYEELRRENPSVSNTRIYKILSLREHLTHDTIRLIIKAEGREIPKRTQP